MQHRACSQLIGQRTHILNAVQGHLREFGIIAERGLLGLAGLAAIVRTRAISACPQRHARP